MKRARPWYSVVVLVVLLVALAYVQYRSAEERRQAAPPEPAPAGQQASGAAGVGVVRRAVAGVDPGRANWRERT